MHFSVSVYVNYSYYCESCVRAKTYAYMYVYVCNLSYSKCDSTFFRLFEFHLPLIGDQQQQLQNESESFFFQSNLAFSHTTIKMAFSFLYSILQIMFTIMNDNIVCVLVCSVTCFKSHIVDVQRSNMKFIAS